jgi:hypothetical protein
MARFPRTARNIFEEANAALVDPLNVQEQSKSLAARQMDPTLRLVELKLS